MNVSRTTDPDLLRRTQDARLVGEGSSTVREAIALYGTRLRILREQQRDAPGLEAALDILGSLPSAARVVIRHHATAQEIVTAFVLDGRTAAWFCVPEAPPTRRP